MSRSLLIAPQWIGDAVMSEPLLARLEGRGERVTVAALPWVAPVYRAMASVAAVVELPFAHGRLDWAARRRLGAQWRGQFERAYVLPNSIKAALLPWLASIPVRIGYQGEGRPLLLTQRLPNPGGRPPMVAFYSALAGPTWAADAAAQPRLAFSGEQMSRVCAAQGLAPQGYFAFAPGAEYGPAKCWPAEHYAALASRLFERHGLPVLLLGSAKERALCEGIAAAAAPGACRVLCGTLPLIDAMTLIAAARGVASNDSGLMHVAAAFRVPQVAMFGSTSPEHTPPLSPRARVLWLKDELALDCAPCFERQCRYGHTRCLTEISPQRADEALAEALRSTRTPIDHAYTEALMREALLNAGTSAWAWDIGSGALSDVETSSALLGYGPGEVANHQDAWDHLIHPDDREANHAAYLRHARGESPHYEHAYRALARDGSWRWINERGRIVDWSEQGEPSRMVGTLTDITLRRQAEGEALEAAVRLRNIARHVPGVVYQFRRLADGSGQFPYVSDSSADLFGISPQALVEDGTALMRLMDREDRDRVAATVDESARGLKPWACDFRLRHSSGEWRWVRGSSSPQTEADGSVVWYGYLQDITDQRALDSERRDRLAAEAANQAKTAFLSQVSHELRTPLNAVLGFSQLLEIDAAEPLTPGQQRRVRLIREAGEHLLRMIGDLLDMTRIETGKLELLATRVPLASMVHEAAQMLDALAREQGVQLVLPRLAEPAAAWADPGRLRQILINLLSNAIKYNHRGGSVTVRLQAQGHELLVEVSDTGQGIAKEQMPGLFEPFNRLGQQHGPVVGSGIGLAVTQALVTAMQGRITVSSTPGQGSVFGVWLPGGPVAVKGPGPGPGPGSEAELADVEHRAAGGAGA